MRPARLGEWGSIPVGSTRRRLSFFIMVLCYSRLMYLEFTVSQTMEHFLACHEQAFAAFRGCPARLMIDNLKSAVLGRVVGQAPVFNPRYVDFARHWGFDITACNVARGNEKGRVENGVGYVKKNFLNGQDFLDFSAVNPAAQLWLETIANVRCHGETHRRPADLFTDRVCIYHQARLIARHLRSYDRHQDLEDPDHPKALLAQRRSAKEQRLLMRFLSLSRQAQAYYEGIAQRRANPRHHLRKIVALSEIYGVDAIDRAIQDGIAFAAYSCEYIANILEMRGRDSAEPAALQLTRRADLLEIDIDAPDLLLYEGHGDEP